MRTIITVSSLACLLVWVAASEIAQRGEFVNLLCISILLSVVYLHCNEFTDMNSKTSLLEGNEGVVLIGNSPGVSTYSFPDSVMNWVKYANYRDWIW